MGVKLPLPELGAESAIVESVRSCIGPSYYQPTHQPHVHATAAGNCGKPGLESLSGSFRV
jgi:hypothetical protein